MDDLHDIADPRPFLPAAGIPFWIWIAIAVASLVALAALVVLLRRKPAPSNPAEFAYEESRQALQNLREAAAGHPLAEVATAASLAIRHYLATTLDEPALYETHEETLTRTDAFASLPTGARERLAPLLNRLADCKYGPSSSDPDAAAALVDNCLEVLQGLESTRARPLA